MPNAPKHILVIRLSAMGDVAMTVNVLRAFTKQYPLVKITVLTRGFFSPFFRDIENVSVFAADLKGEHKGVYGLYKLARQLNKEHKFYAIADLHNVLRTKVLKKIIRCKRFASINKGRAEKKALTTGKIFEQLKTTHQRYADVFKTLGFPVDLSNPTFPEPKAIHFINFDGLNSKTEKWIGIAPFAAHKGKMYPLELMTEVIESLSKNYKVILFGGGNEESKILEAIEKKYPTCINLAGKLTLKEELDVISNLDVMLSMDSGNAHLAAMLGVKVITIWGVTHPYAGFAPFNQPEDYALVANRDLFPQIPTSVYGNKYPKNYKDAAGSISSQIIINKIESII